MSWRDRIDSELTGYYGRAKFHVEQSDTTGGRRWLIHEYPRRNLPYSEDMGLKAGEWRLQFFVAGDDYDIERDALRAELDSPGAKTLVHPYLGTFMAVASDVRFRESTRDGGVCTFQVTFAGAGQEAYPATTVDTKREVQRTADVVEEETTRDFAEKWSVEGLLGWSLVSVERDLSAIVSGINEVVGGIADDIAAQIRAPINMAGILIGGYNRLLGAVMRPINALDLYSGNSILSMLGLDDDDDDSSGQILLSPGTPVRAARLLFDTGTGSDSVTPPVADTPERLQRAQNTIAARELNGRAALLAGARLMADTDWVSRQDALAAGNDVIALIDAQMASDNTIDDGVYSALVDLRSAVSEDMRTRAVALPGMTSHTPLRTLPAVIVAHRLYGDARRADEIVVRNNIAHPGAVRGGMELEVLGE